MSYINLVSQLSGWRDDYTERSIWSTTSSIDGIICMDLFNNWKQKCQSFPAP